MYHQLYLLLVQCKSSTRGLSPVTRSIILSHADQKWIFSSGKLSQPVVIQKQVSCGATWCTRWWRFGKMMCIFCSHSTQDGRAPYVCDHLWIWFVMVIKNISDINMTQLQYQERTWSGDQTSMVQTAYPIGTRVTKQLSPLASTKSCLVIANGSMWCSLNGRMNACGGEVEGRERGNERKQANRGKEKGKGKYEQIMCNTTYQYQLPSSLTDQCQAYSWHEMAREMTDFEMEEIQNESVKFLPIPPCTRSVEQIQNCFESQR